MTDNSKKLTDEKMDQLLTAFYALEVPEQLEQLPSSWSKLQVTRADLRPSTSDSKRSAPVGTFGRGLAVAAATLAACLAVVAISSPQTSENVPGGTVTEVQPEVDPGNATFNVSSDGASQSLGNDQPTLEEIDSIELNPVPNGKQDRKSD
ncbi:MAG: hypothetical protein R3C49_11865 [Planctomycetaceae bacterium]